MTENNINPAEFPSEEDEQQDAQTDNQTHSDDEVVDKLLDANQELEKKLQASEDQLLRLQAEMQNIKKHHQQDQANLIKYDGQKLATSILPSIDNLQRALQAQNDDDPATAGIITGVEMVLKHLQQALAENDITEIAAEGEKFDPTVHQAVQMVPADDEHEAETIVQVLQAGYKLKDRVLRPSMVVVAQ